MAPRNSNGKPRAQKSLIPAVGYIRMSTDRQEHSPERQRAEIIELAERDGYHIIRWYEDHGLTGTESANRPEFQRLLQDASDGRFQAILLYEQSRFSREDIFDVMLHWRLLRQAGVDIVTCQRGRLRFDDLGGILTAIIDQHGAREESMKLAQRVVSGQRQRARQGQRNGGVVFAYDREIRDEAGKVVRRVHFRERFKRPSNWTTHLVPSKDRAAVKAVQWAFEAIREGHSVSYVVREFRDRGLTTTYGNPFKYSSVRGMLTNPAYAGILRAGHYTRGRFCSLGADGPIIVEDSHEALVTPEVFDAVQELLAGRKQRHERCPSGRYLLSGILRCRHCGGRMHGVRFKPRKHSRGGLYYQCSSTNPNAGSHDPDCPLPVVRADQLEAFLLGTIRERLLETGAEDRIREAIIRLTARDAKATSKDEKRLQKLRQKIERGTENLALATKQDFAAISKLLQTWREEEAELVDQIERRNGDLKPLPEALRVIARFTEIRENLDHADRVKLANAIQLTVASITIGIRETRTGNITHNEFIGELRFHKALAIDGPITIPDEAVGHRKIWREIGVLASQQERPLRLADLFDLIGSCDPSHASYHMRRAVEAGVVKKLPKQGGWVAASFSSVRKL